MITKDYQPYLDHPKPRKQMTNADHIRSMTDDELAVWLDDFTANCLECEQGEGHNANCPIYKENCRYCEPKDLMDWLKQPYNEG